VFFQVQERISFQRATTEAQRQSDNHQRLYPFDLT
jgi:hypothetical protein